MAGFDVAIEEQPIGSLTVATMNFLLTRCAEKIELLRTDPQPTTACGVCNVQVLQRIIHGVGLKKLVERALDHVGGWIEPHPVRAKPVCETGWWITRTEKEGRWPKILVGTEQAGPCGTGRQRRVDLDKAPVVLRVDQCGNADLFLIVHALDLPGAGFGPAEGRQQQTGENRDDGNDYEQLNQREPAASQTPGLNRRPRAKTTYAMELQALHAVERNRSDAELNTAASEPPADYAKSAAGQPMPKQV